MSRRPNGYRDVAARHTRGAPSQGGGYGGSMPDAIFAHPLLARIYDAFDGNRDDLDLYVDLIRGLDAQHVLDVGCGTGSLSILLAHCGVKVTAVDPAAASLEVARPKRVQIG